MEQLTTRREPDRCRGDYKPMRHIPHPREDGDKAVRFETENTKAETISNSRWGIFEERSW